MKKDYITVISNEKPETITYIEMGELRQIYRRLKRGEILTLQHTVIDYGKKKK
jgi:hypothetical protein